MEFQFNFGTLSARPARPEGGAGFRIALLGDFSAGANRGRLETGDPLAARKPLRVDCDNVDATLARLKVDVALPLAQGVVRVSLRSMDDFHPEQLYGNLDLFAELSGLRQRLGNRSTFAKAAQEIQSWAEAGETVRPGNAPARGSAVPAGLKLSDFSKLVGRSSAPETTTAPVEALLRRVVGPYIEPAKDPAQDAMIDAVDDALSGAMRGVLHHPDFQAIEALWRSVDFLVRRLETDDDLQIVLYDISAEELAADLGAGDALEDSALYRLLVEAPAGDVNQGPLAAVIGLYTFERTPPHAELLGRMARIVAQAPAPFISAIASDCLDQDPKDLHPLIKQSWKTLAAMPEAGYLGLVSPRFLLRLPYGEKTEPVDAFDFEEFTVKTGLRGMLWGNPAVIAALLLGQTYVDGGAKMPLGSVLSVGEMPFYYYTDKDGDQVALPSTERFMTSRLSSLLGTQGFIPLVCMKGAPEVRLGGFQSLAGADVAGFWAPIALPPPPPPKPAAPPAAQPAPPAAAAPVPAPAHTPSPAPVPVAAKPAPAPTAKAPAPAAKPAQPPPAPAKTPTTAPVPIVAKPAPPAPKPAPAAAPAPAVAKSAPPIQPSPKPAPPAPPPVQQPPPDAPKDELDALLENLAEQKEEKDAQAEEAEMDPDLKALLADL